MDNSLSGLMRRVDLAIIQQFAGIDVLDLPKQEREVVEMLRRTVIDAKLDLRDYELSETRLEQLKYLTDTQERLEILRKGILQASEIGLFGAADVAQLTATLEQITEQIT